MEKPGVLIPTPFIPKLSLPKIGPVIEIPKVPTMQQRLYGEAPVFEFKEQSVPSYMADYNDPTQNNSIADLLVRNILRGNSFRPTLEPAKEIFEYLNYKFTPLIRGIGKHVNNFEKTAEDDLDARDEFIIAGKNLFVDVVETLDIVDNFQKAVTIPLFQEKTGLQGAAQGLVNAVGRKNYDWDTGNVALNFVLEVATPSNILSAGIGLGAKTAGKFAGTSIKALAQAVDVPLSKSFITNILGVGNGSKISQKVFKEVLMSRGNTQAIAQLAKRLKLDPDDIVKLLRVSQHKNASAAIDLITKADGARALINSIDGVGVKLAFMTTGLFPAWKVFKWGGGKFVKHVQYGMAALERHLPSKTLYDVVQQGSTLVDEADTLYQASTKFFDGRLPKDVVAELLSEATADSMRQVYATVAEIRKIKPEELTSEVIRAHLDKLARQLTGDKLVTMTDYKNFLTELTKVSDSGTGVYELAELTDNLLRLDSTVAKQEAHAAFTAIRERLDASLRKVVPETSTIDKTIKTIEEQVDHLARTGYEHSAVYAISDPYEAARLLGDNDALIELRRLDASPKISFDTQHVVMRNPNYEQQKIQIDNLYNTYVETKRAVERVSETLRRVIDDIKFARGDSKMVDLRVAAQDPRALELLAMSPQKLAELKQTAIDARATLNALKKRKIAAYGAYNRASRNFDTAKVPQQLSVPIEEFNAARLAQRQQLVDSLNTRLDAALRRIDSQRALAELELDNARFIKEEEQLNIMYERQDNLNDVRIVIETLHEVQPFDKRTLKKLRRTMHELNNSIVMHKYAGVPAEFIPDRYTKEFNKNIKEIGTVLDNYEALNFGHINMSAKEFSGVVNKYMSHKGFAKLEDAIKKVAKTVDGSHIPNNERIRPVELRDSLVSILEPELETLNQILGYIQGNVRDAARTDPEVLLTRMLDSYTDFKEFVNEMMQPAVGGIHPLSTKEGMEAYRTTLLTLDWHLMAAEDVLKELAHNAPGSHRNAVRVAADAATHKASIMDGVDIKATIQENLESILAGQRHELELADSALRTVSSAQEALVKALGDLGIHGEIIDDVFKHGYQEWQLSMSGAYRSLHLFELEEVSELVNAAMDIRYDNKIINYLTTIANWTDESMKDYTRAATDLLTAIEDMGKYRQFILDITNATDISEPVKLRFLDAISSYYDKSYKLSNYDVRKLLDNVRTQVEQISVKENFRLENAHLRLADKGEHYKAMFPGGSSHVGSADAYKTKLIFDEKFKQVLGEGDVPIFVDFEAQSAYSKQARGSQAGVVLADGTIFQINVHNGPLAQVPFEMDLLRTLLGEGAQGKSYIELREQYIKMFSNPNGEEAARAFQEWFDLPSHINVITVPNEQALAEEVARLFRDNAPKTTKGRLRPVMHNGLEYDLELFNSMMERGEVKRYINGVESNATYRLADFDIIDTLPMLKEGKVTTLSIDEEMILEELIYKYMESRDASFYKYNKHPNAIKLSLNDDLHPTVRRPFAPNFGGVFADSLKRLSGLTEEVNKQIAKEGISKASADMIQAARNIGVQMDVGQSFATLRDVVGKHIESLKNVQADLGMYRFDRYLDDEALGTIVTNIAGATDDALSTRGNITALFQRIADSVGEKYPMINVRRRKSSALTNWFTIKEGQVYAGEHITRMNKLMQRFTRTLENVENLELLEASTNILDIRKAMNEMLNAMHQVGGGYYAAPFYALKEPDNLAQGFAMASELFRQVDHILSQKSKSLVGASIAGQLRGAGVSNDLVDLLVTPKKLRKFNHDTSLYNMLTSNDQELQNIIDYYTANYNTIQEAVNAQELLTPTTRLKVMGGLYEPMIDYFNVIKAGEDAYMAAAESKMKFVTDKAVEKSRFEYHAKVRMGVEQYENILAYNKVAHTLSLEPETMLDYLYRRANGIVVTHSDALISTRYAVERNLQPQSDLLRSDAAAVAFRKMLENKEQYEALGIEIIGRKRGRGTEIIIKLKDELRELPPPQVSKPYVDAILDTEDIMTYIKAFDDVEGTVSKAVASLRKARTHLETLNVAAHNSTMEKVDRRVFDEIRAKLGMDFKDIPDTFELSAFNHSILGPIDLRKEYMSHTPFNPAKTMFNTVSLLHNTIDDQIKYTTMMFNNAMKVAEFAQTAEQKHALADYLKQNYMDYRVGFLKPDKKRGFVVASMHVTTAIDVQKAIDFGGVILDSNTLDTAYATVNRYRIENKFLLAAQKYWTVPRKIGFMAFSPVTAARNVLESGLKNLDVTQDPAILMESFAWMGVYYNYTRIVKRIRTVMENTGYRWDRAVDEVYANKKGMMISRDVFDEISLFKGSDASGGMSRAIQEFYGDSIDKLYKHFNAEHPALVDKEVFRKYLTSSDDYFETLLETHGYTEKTKKAIRTSRTTLLRHKQAYQMHKLYHGQELTQNDFFRYLINQQEIPDHLRPQVLDLMHKTRHMQIKEDMMTRFMHTSVVDRALDMTGGVEESMRLALFSYLRRNGTSTLTATNITRKAHFDYKNRKHWQLYTELLMPFSTFKMNSFDYWIEAMWKHNKTSKAIGEYIKQQWFFPKEDREPQDILRSRSLQYQLLSGNPTVFTRNYTETNMKGKETERQDDYALKVSAPFMMPFQFIVSPLEELEGMLDSTPQDLTRFVQALKGELKQYNIQQYDNESDEDYAKRLAYAKENKMMGQESDEDYERRLVRAKAAWIPMIGPWIGRAFSKQIVENPFANMVLNMLVSQVYVPQDYRINNYNEGFDNMQPRLIVAKDGTKIRAWRAKQSQYTKLTRYHAFSRYSKGRPIRIRGVRAYPNQVFRNINIKRSDIWKKYISRKGKSMFRMRAFPTNQYTRALKARLYRRFIVSK